MNQPDASPQDRLHGLSASAVEQLHAAARAIRDNALTQSIRLLKSVLSTHRRHPEAMRLLGITHSRAGQHADAVHTFELALETNPDDAWLHNDFANALAAADQLTAAFGHWQHAADAAPHWVMPPYNLGRNHQLQGDSTRAVFCLQRACEIEPSWLPARILLGDALVHLGQFDEASSHYRHALALHPACGDAWRGLSNIKTQPLSENDAVQLHEQLARSGIGDEDRIAMRYALGRLEEDRGNHAEALHQLQQANAALNRRQPWSRPAFAQQIESLLNAACQLPAPIDLDLGHEIIFIVGMPRSGSTLFEQILAAHPQVEGASELPDLDALFRDESARRGKPLADWLTDASAEDWQRLGLDYLQRTARWRQQRPRMTDKMPENWRYADLLRVMLPAATIIEIRRDALETAWSCYRQQFYRLPHFANDYDDLAHYLNTCNRTMDRIRADHPGRVHVYRYETLLAEPESTVRRLLDHCGLPWDVACLDFHQATRSVRTASAAQVRQPLRRDSARAIAYGALLDPLRSALID